MTASEKYRVCSIHARFIQALLPLLFTFFDWKTSKWAYHLLQFLIYCWEKFLKLIIPQSLLIAFEFFLFFLFFSHFLTSSTNLDDYFFRWLAYKSLLSRFSLLINYIMSFSNLFSDSSYFPCFSWSRVFRVQGFQGPSPEF